MTNLPPALHLSNFFMAPKSANVPLRNNPLLALQSSAFVKGSRYN